MNGNGVGRVRINASNVSFASGNSHEALDWIPSEYIPLGYYYAITQRTLSNTLLIYLWSSPSVIGVTNTASSTKTMSLDGTIVYSY